jgi:DNA-binding PadR family transcriptional regulator
MPKRRLSVPALSVLTAIADGVQFGFDVIDVTGLPSGTVYPALSRLERDGYVKSTWERAAAAHAEGRPARRYYRVTAAGTAALADATAQYRALLPSLDRGKPR